MGEITHLVEEVGEMVSVEEANLRESVREMRVLFDVDAFIPRRLLGLLLVAAERFLGEDRVAGEVDARYLAMNQRIKELEERVATLIEVVGARARREG